MSCGESVLTGLTAEARPGLMRGVGWRTMALWGARVTPVLQPGAVLLLPPAGPTVVVGDAGCAGGRPAGMSACRGGSGPLSRRPDRCPKAPARDIARARSIPQSLARFALWMPLATVPERQSFMQGEAGYRGVSIHKNMLGRVVVLAVLLPGVSPAGARCRPRTSGRTLRTGRLPCLPACRLPGECRDRALVGTPHLCARTGRSARSSTWRSPSSPRHRPDARASPRAPRQRCGARRTCAAPAARRRDYPRASTARLPPSGTSGGREFMELR